MWFISQPVMRHPSYSQVAKDLKRGEGHESIYVYGHSLPLVQSKGSLAGNIKAYRQFE